MVSPMEGHADTLLTVAIVAWGPKGYGPCISGYRCMAMTARATIVARTIAVIAKADMIISAWLWQLWPQHLMFTVRKALRW